MNFEEFLLESDATEEAHRLGLTATGHGLWRDRSGKIVKKTVDGRLQNVQGSAANIRHYDSDLPKGRAVNHSDHDEASNIVGHHETENSHRESEVSKQHLTQHSSVSAGNREKLHNDLVKAGYTHNASDMGHNYRKGKSFIQVSNRPEVSHRPGGTTRDHHSVTMQTEHNKVKR